MAITYDEFYVTPGGSDLNAGSGPGDDPIYTYDDVTAVEAGGVITDNTPGGPWWVDVPIGAWLLLDEDDTKQLALVASINDAVLTTLTSFNAVSNVKVRVGGSWATLGHADESMGIVVLHGEFQPRVNIEGNTFTEEFEITNVGDDDNIITYEGYFADIGDGGLDNDDNLAVIIDGEDSRECIWTALASTNYLNTIFRTIRCTQANTKSGFDLNIKAVTYEKCESDNNAANGIYGYQYTTVIGGSFHDNDVFGIRCQIGSLVLNADIFDNTSYGISCDNTAVIGFNRITGNGHGISMYVADGNAVIRSNTIDNETTTGFGIRLFTSGTSAHRPAIFNNIITRCNVPIDGGNLDTALAVSRNNLLWANTNPPANWDLTDDDLSGDPLFVDQDGRDYNIKPGSPAEGTAYGGGDIGAIPRAHRLISHPGMVGGMRG